MKEIRRGARVKGVVVQVKDDELLVDIGGKSEGVLSASELTTDDAKHIRERFAIGDDCSIKKEVADAAFRRLLNN